MPAFPKLVAACALLIAPVCLHVGCARTTHTDDGDGASVDRRAAPVGGYRPLTAGDIPVSLRNELANLGNSFVVSADFYIDEARRFRVKEGETHSGLEPYLVRSGTLLSVELPDHPDAPLNGLYVVRPEGTIDVGPVSDFPASGRSVAEIRADLSGRLARWYRGAGSDGRPLVAVNLPVASGDQGPAHGRALVFNHSGHELSFDPKPALTGDDTLLSVLASAGVQAPPGGLGQLQVMRRVRSGATDRTTGFPFEFYVVILVDIDRLLYADPNINVDIRDGDIIVLTPPAR